MSNKIFGSDIVDQSANVEVQKLQGEMKTLLEIFIQNSRAVELMRKALSNADGYSAVSDAIKNTNKALDEQTKVKNQILALEKHLDVAKTEEYKKLIQLREERNKNNRELREEAKNAIYATDAYKKLEAEYIAASRGAKALGAELGINDQRFKTAAANANALHDRLKAIDGSMGIHTRNVGNYASATNSLSQVLREMPAFTYSVQTGILGLSNNLPILIDQFKQTAKEAGGSMQALKIFAGSMFSFTNILTIGIGLVTIFADKIFGAGESAKKAKEEIKDAGDVMQEAYNSSEFKQAIQNVTELETEVKAAKDGILDKDQVVKHYNETMGKTTGIVKTLNDVEQSLVKNTDSYLQMMLMKAAAHISLEEAAKKSVEAEKTRLRELDKIKPEEGRYGGFINDVKSLMDDEGSLAEDAVANVNKMVDGVKKEGEEFEKIAKMFLTNAMNISKAMNFNFFGDNKVDKPKKERQKKSPVVDIPDHLSDSEIEDLKKYYDDVEKWRAKILGEYVNDPAVQKRLLLDLDENMNIDEPVSDEVARDIADSLNKQIQDKLKKQKALEIKIEKLELDMKAVQLGADFLQSLNQIIYNAEIAQIERRDKKLQDSYDSRRQQIENSYSIQADRERELKKLEAERAAQQRSIDNQRRAAERRRAIGQKWTNVGEIIASTALAVIKAFTEGDPYTKSGRAALAAAVGAVSLAKALAAPIPQYKEGTPKEGHKGGLAIIGDGGVPEYVEEPGKKGYWSKPFAQIVDLPAKTVVTPPEKLIEKLMMSTMASLGKLKVPVTTDSYQSQMLVEYEAMTKELRETKKILERKNFSVNINGDLSHLLRMKELIS